MKISFVFRNTGDIYFFITLTPGVSFIKDLYIFTNAAVKFNRAYFPYKIMVNLDRPKNIRLD